MARPLILAGASLSRRGIALREGDRVIALEPGSARLAGGSVLPCDRVLLATGVEPPGLFGTSGLPTGPDGGLLVGPGLNCPDHPEIFGGGDCIHFAPRPLDKVGVHAVRQGPLLHRNLLAALTGKTVAAYRPQRGYLLILNLGDGRGLACRGRWCLDGRPALWFKDRLDRRFMTRYQRPGAG